MKKLIFLTLLIVAGVSINTITAQSKYFTRSGEITFSSKAPLEDIEANNSSATSVLDAESGKIQFAVLIKAFKFKKALMEEHFNENYMESDKFPKSTFVGQIDNISEINFAKDGEYKALISGVMTIHGVSNDLKTEGTFTVSQGIISAASNFKIAVADYNIEVPKLVRDNIAKIVDVTVNLGFEALNKSK